MDRTIKDPMSPDLSVQAVSCRRWALGQCLPRKHSSSTIRASNFVFIAYPNEDL